MNAGNLFGMAASAGLLLFSFALHRYGDAIPKAVRISISVFYFALGAAAVLMTIVMLVGAHTAFPHSDSASAPTVIVLGCKTKSRMMDQRIKEAYAYLLAHPESPCILSGGTGPDEPCSEAAYMYQKLTEMGIDPSRLIPEEESLDTFQNLRFSAAVIRKLGLSSRTALVTHEFHQYRACRIAKRHGLTPAAVCAPTPWWLFVTYCWREALAIMREWFFTPI